MKRLIWVLCFFIMVTSVIFPMPTQVKALGTGLIYMSYFDQGGGYFSGGGWGSTGASKPIPDGFVPAGASKDLYASGVSRAWIINPRTGDIRFSYLNNPDGSYSGSGWSSNVANKPLPEGYIPAGVYNDPYCDTCSRIIIINPTTGKIKIAYLESGYGFYSGGFGGDLNVSKPIPTGFIPAGAYLDPYAPTLSRMVIINKNTGEIRWSYLDSGGGYFSSGGWGASGVSKPIPAGFYPLGAYPDPYCDTCSRLTLINFTHPVPNIEVVSPISGQILSEFNTAFIPSIKISDPDGDTLIASYFLDSETSPRDTKVISNTQTAQTVSFNALNIESIIEGTHTIRFTVDDGSAKVESIAQVMVDKTSPVLGVVAATSTDTLVQISGSASDSISGLSSESYRYSIGSNTSAWTSLLQYTQSNLTPNTNYNVKFEARDNVGHIASQEQLIRTKAQAPTLSLSQATESGLDISFSDSNPSSTQYQVQIGGQYVNAAGTVTTAPAWIPLTNKTIKVTGLAPNTSYSFQAKAKNELGVETNYGPLAGGTTLASPPAPITTELAQRLIKLSWPATPGIASYDVEVDGGVPMNNGTSTTFSHNGLAPNTQHNYRVRANNAGGTGKWSPLISKFTLPDPPAVPTGIQAVPLQTQMTISWDSVARAEGYDIKVDGGTEIDNGAQTTYVHRNLQPLTEHTYQVRAKNPGGISQWSEPVLMKTLPNPPNTPDNLTADLSIHQVMVNWSTADGADAYEIEVDGLRTENGNKTTYLHDGLDALSGHTYRVRAKNIGGMSAWSEPLDVTTHPEIPNIPTNIMTTAEEKSITTTWYKVPHASSYEVEIDGITKINVTNNQFVHSDLEPDSRHTYRVRAKNISGDSEWSAPVTLTTFPSGSDTTLSLTNIAAIVTNRYITISWDTVAPEARYDIEVDGVLMNNGDDTIYHHTGLKANEFHTYKIRLQNEDHPGEWVAMLSLSTLPNPPDAPTDIEAFATNNSIELRWQKNSTATGYDIEIDGKTMDAGEAASYLHDELSSGTAHTYRVRAKNVTGVTAWSAAIVKSTTSPTYTVNGEKEKTFDLSLLASNVQDFSEMTYVVTYDPSQLEAIDLFGFTPNADLPTAGKIPGSNLDVTYTAGEITFRINQNVVPGTSWSGEIATIVFKSKVDGQAQMNVVVE
ncbi:fibronectin type III domain-containing protein [Paenibacillus qinlingensis]|uniref:Fibronectin type-III domain-containing protein n=1 Tax=Paenibacillus qinlingensis TaxID=1837343 RepID=A0ABU1P152_9BACL|nr:hypothetical protein [Paenibacillus qinlingensis]MDR6553471.1 hypothetical protein [Paenibacillus qinlingensis]